MTIKFNMTKIYFRGHTDAVGSEELIASFVFVLDAERYVDELNGRIKSGDYDNSGYFYIDRKSSVDAV